MRAGKHVRIEMPLADTLRNAQAVVDLKKSGPGRHVRSDAPLQSASSMSPQADPRRRVHPAKGCADAFFFAALR
jgi:hypothetical protein